MSSILTKIFAASAILAAVTLTAAPGFAETSLTVPFSFVAAGKLCPAGEYRVERNLLNGVITLKSSDGLRNFAWVAGPGAPSPTSTHVVLRFDDCGSMHYLNSIQSGSGITGRLDTRSIPGECHAALSGASMPQRIMPLLRRTE